MAETVVCNCGLICQNPILPYLGDGYSSAGFINFASRFTYASFWLFSLGLRRSSTEI